MPDDLRKVTPSAPGKTHYVIVDAVGVTKSIKTDSQPLDTKPSVPFKDLAMGLMMADRSEETVSSLAGRLSRLDNKFGAETRQGSNRPPARPCPPSSAICWTPSTPTRSRPMPLPAGNPEPRRLRHAAAREERIKRAANVFTGPVST